MNIIILNSIVLKLLEAQWSWIDTAPILGFLFEDSCAEWLEWISDSIFRTGEGLNHDHDSPLISCGQLYNWKLESKPIFFFSHLSSTLLMLKRIVMNWSLTICSCRPACKLSQTNFFFLYRIVLFVGSLLCIILYEIDLSCLWSGNKVVLQLNN